MSDQVSDQEIPVSALADGFVYFSQTDPRWAEVPYTVTGEKEQTIGTSGCVPTLQAVVLAHLCDLSLTPPELADWNIQNGLRTERSGTRRASWNLLAQQVKLEVDALGKSPQALEKASMIGGIIIVSLSGTGRSQLGTPSGHVVGLRNVTRTAVKVIDTNSRANSERWWRHEDLLPFARSNFKHIYRREPSETFGNDLRLATAAEHQAAETLAYTQDQANNL